MYLMLLTVFILSVSRSFAGFDDYFLNKTLRIDYYHTGNDSIDIYSLDELISGNYISFKGERPPYIYDVEINSGSFRATATRTTKGAPAQLWITDTMQVQASD